MTDLLLLVLGFAAGSALLALFPVCGAHYTSTACHHGEHERCRLGCKHCDEQCRCWCHRLAPTEEPV